MAEPLILVVGSTGTVGREVVKQLVEAGKNVRALARDPVKAAELGAGVEKAFGDLTQPETLGEAFAGAEQVFVLAPPVPNMEELEVNAFAAAAAAGARQIVYLSNFGAGAFDDDLFRAHGANEKRLQKLGVEWTVLRPTRFMTNTPFGWAAIRDRGQLIEPLGGRKVVMIDPRDIAAVAIKALTTQGHDGKIYELSGEALTGLDMAEHLSIALARPIEFVDATVEEARVELLRSGLPPLIVDKVLFYFATVRADRWYEMSAVREVLGRAPRTYSAWLEENAQALGCGPYLA